MASRNGPGSNWRCSSATRELALQRFGESGLTLYDADTLGLDVLDNVAARDALFQPRPGIVLPYYDPIRGGPLKSHPGWPDFYRVRYLGGPPPGFGNQTTAKPSRYAQPKGSGVCAYFPRGLVPWKDVLKDLDTPLFITEGEIKAAKACAEGYPTIGLGGVYNWRSAREGISFLPELEAVPWVQRVVYLVFDSDFRTNAMVCMALRMLAEQLYQRGAIPYLISLPELGEADRKTGLDDFLVAQGRAGFDPLCLVAQPLTLCQALWTLNDEVTYARDPGLIIINASQQRVAPEKFSSHLFANRPYCKNVVDEKGEIKLKPANAALDWIHWPMRAEVEKLEYLPGKDAGVTQDDGRYVFNLWKGWGAQPKKGNVKPFTDLIKHLFLKAEPVALEWFLDWCAYPLQHPGTKLYSACLLHGIRHGTGKSLVGVTLGRIYGSNYAYLTQKEIFDERREWAENKQFALGDEVTGTEDRRRHSDEIKTMITQETLRINVKYIPSYAIKDCINYLFTSNHPDAFYLEADDRRFFVQEVLVDPLPDTFYQAYVDWLDNQGGAAALFEHFLARDLTGFNPAAHAYKTRARDKLIAVVKSDLGQWVESLRRKPDELLIVGKLRLTGDLFTARELRAIYDPLEIQKHLTPGGVSRELMRAGFTHVGDGERYSASDGRQEQFFVVRNVAKWFKAKPADILNHIARKYRNLEFYTEEAKKY